MSISIPGYEITENLFSNGRTRVDRAVRVSDGRSVVLKYLEDALPDASQLSRFSFCYDVLCRFDHPNIIKPLDWIKGDQTPIMVLEDHQSIDLLHYLTRFPAGQLPLDIFLTLAAQLAEALSIIHHAQVIHKDLHPGNILVNPATLRLQVIDFGIASLLTREQPALQAPEKLEGVLAYLSPEQTGRMNRAVDYRSDFYTLGITFYHLLTGKVPFEAEDAIGVVHAHIARTQVPVSEIRPEVPAVLSAIVDKLMNKTAEMRYQSALGLKKDLDKCRIALSRNLPVPEFPLGMEDISDRFQIPQKLYGREEETSLLLRRFFQAAGGKPRMLAVSGYSGIGKSALIHEVHKPIASYNGRFLSGKFDQFQRNIPYSAVQTALKGWIQHTLSLNPEKLAERREKLNLELGPNARVLIDFMPELEWVLGPLSPVAKLGADETQNRFHLIFQGFISLITREHPVVIFIDDLQWADRGTLGLLPLLLGEENCRLLVIVAYRDNEVDEHHPASQTLRKIAEAPLTASAYSEIRLGPLQRDQVIALLEDALFRPAIEVSPLAELIFTKTSGNPFFISELLKTLYTEGMLNFDLQRQRWIWNVDEINAKGMTNNVVELMLSKMAQLPTETQALFQLAACIGSRFSLELLALIAQRPIWEVARELWPALQEGLLLQDGGDWLLGVVQNPIESIPTAVKPDDLRTRVSPLSPSCRFLHDRMLQAAYQSMSETARCETHLKVGRLLLAASQGGIISDDSLFSIVEQFNEAQHLIDVESEKQALVRLNLSAAERAQAASVWQAAYTYSRIGIDLLPANAWEANFDECRRLYDVQAECAYLMGNLETSDRVYGELFNHIDDAVRKAEMCATRLTQSIGRGQWQNGFEFGRQGLAFLELPIPDEHRLLFETEQALERLESVAKDRVLWHVDQLPDMTERRYQIALKIYSNLALNSRVLGQPVLGDYCTIVGCNLIWHFGKSDLAAIQLLCYAYLLRRRQFLKQAFEQAVEARRLAESYQPCREIANCYNVLGSMIWYLGAPLSDCIELNQRGVSLGLDSGEIARASINLSNALATQVSQGAPLKRVAERSREAVDFLQKRNIFFPIAEFIRRFTSALQDNSSTLGLDENNFDPAHLALIKRSFHYTALLHYQSQLAFWRDDRDVALRIAKDVQSRYEMMPRATYAIDHYMFLGLLLLWENASLSPTDQTLLDECRFQLKHVSEVYAPTFNHKRLLLEVECARFQRADMETISRGYRDAIEEARKYGFTQFQALASERFAEYWLNKGMETLAEPFMREALYLYRVWGCQVKVSGIRRIHASLLQVAEKRVQREFSRTESLNSGKSFELDIASAMKAAQVISSELNLRSLAGRVLGVIVESAGATSGALILQSTKGPRVEARVGRDKQVELPEPPALLAVDSELPRNVISYVLHSHEIVSLGDVLAERAFTDDPYLMSRHPKCILCMPVMYRDQTIGALYLENNLTLDSFTEGRLGVINLLLAQSAISFENARLFGEVSSLNQTLERKVENRTRDLAEANQQLSQVVDDLQLANEELNAFSYSVSHDLRSPLRAIKSFAQLLTEDFGERLDNNGRSMLDRIVRGSQKMSDLIDGLLELSRLHRREVALSPVNLSAMVEERFGEMQERFPERRVVTECEPNCTVLADPRMLSALVENLIGNAWKYSAQREIAHITFGRVDLSAGFIPQGVGTLPASIPPDQDVYFIRDDGDGFDMNYASKLFGSFQRLHSEKQFSGTGIGLATVKRVVEKHGGKVWAVAHKGQGATFYFTLKRA